MGRGSPKLPRAEHRRRCRYRFISRYLPCFGTIVRFSSELVEKWACDLPPKNCFRGASHRRVTLCYIYGLQAWAWLLPRGLALRFTCLSPRLWSPMRHQENRHRMMSQGRWPTENMPPRVGSTPKLEFDLQQNASSIFGTCFFPPSKSCFTYPRNRIIWWGCVLRPIKRKMRYTTVFQIGLIYCVPLLRKYVITTRPQPYIRNYCIPFSKLFNYDNPSTTLCAKLR